MSLPRKRRLLKWFVVIFFFCVGDLLLTAYTHPPPGVQLDLILHPRDAYFIDILLSNVPIIRHYWMSFVFSTSMEKIPAAIDGTAYFREYAHIPPLVHLIFLGRSDSLVDELYERDIRSCVRQNPELTFVLWTDKNSQEFLRDYVAPKRQVWMASYLSIPLISRTDILRYLLLEHFGGIYMDLDTYCQFPLHAYVSHQHCLLGMEPPIQSRFYHNVNYSAMTNFMACRPNHPFLQMLIGNLSHQPVSYFHELGPMLSAGPLYLTRQYELYQKLLHSSAQFSDNTNRVQLVDYHLFHPNLNNMELRGAVCYFKYFFTNWRRKACDELSQYLHWFHQHGRYSAVLFHDWSHLGYLSAESLRERRKFDLLKEFPFVKKWPPEGLLLK